MNFGDSSRLKLLKEIILTFIGGQGAQVVVNWGYDYTETYTKEIVTIDSGSQVAYYNQSEFNVSESEYSASIIVDRPRTKTTGTGTVVTIGTEATINTNALSLQEVNIQAIIGRII